MGIDYLDKNTSSVLPGMKETGDALTDHHVKAVFTLRGGPEVSRHRHGGQGPVRRSCDTHGTERPS